ncbi:MAG: SAM-dependent methyltransferase [Kofleriaceae bacterium]|nr:SAM-dependent methyltransferase [Kofleriaceae bacterium]MCB9574684.1 SAM-dependent methyltransferase [Kofleriaceae bacterium]
MATTARDVARRVLARVEQGGAWATLALDGELQRSGLADRDRRLAAELVYGVLRHRARLDRALARHATLGRTPPAALIALRVAAYQLLLLDRVPAHAAVDDAVAAVRRGVGAKVAGFVNAVLRKLAAAGEPPLPDDPRQQLEVACSMPPWIVDELAAALGEPAALAAAAEALTRPAPLWIRVNRRRATVDEVRAALVAEGATVDDAATGGAVAPAVGDGAAAEPAATAPLVAATALRVTGLGDPATSPSFRAGLWTVQDLGAQYVDALADAGALPAGARVLDACAGVGGKATGLAEVVADGVVVDAADVAPAKLALAAEAAARLGLTAVHPVACDLLDPAAPLAAAYDLILLDAPCTGLGVLRRHPEAKWRLAAADVAAAAALQARLLDAMVARLAPGGTLIYSVCTFTRAEGAAQIAALRARHPTLRLRDERVTWPHLDGADAFYMARLTRDAC